MAKKTKKSRFVKTTTEDRQRRGKRKPSNFISIFNTDVTQYKLEEENILRFIPRVEAEAEWLEENMLSPYGIFVHIHYGVGKGGSNKYGFTFLCLEKMLGKPCPVCEDGESTSERLLAWAVDRNKEKEGAQLVNISVGTDDKIYEQARNRKTNQYYEYWDIDKGKDVYFLKKGKEMKTEYYGFRLEESCPLDHDKAEDHALENPIADILKFYSYDEIKSKLYGGVSDSENSSSNVDYDLDDLRDMSENKLKRVASKLKVDLDDDDDKEDIIEAICLHLDIDYEEDSDYDDSDSDSDSDTDDEYDDYDNEDPEDDDDDPEDDDEDADEEDSDDDEEEYIKKIKKAKQKNKSSKSKSKK